ncbi:type VII secretion protein EccE [Gordonia sp. CPCC 205333]|uniref:type VII secretion protein EccE n=1 Tax=Gordonia sp. CPCC 205333 TaxID=3140790 RepID=UPI003AF3A56D
MTNWALAIEAIAAIGLLLWSAIGDARGGYALLGALTVGLLASLRPIRSRFTNRWRQTQFALRRARRDPRDVLSPAFDIPFPDTSRRAGGITPQLGARWIGDTLITMLGVHDPEPGLTHITRDGVVAGRSGQTLTMSVLTNCLNTFDIPVDSVDLISHGRRTAGPGHIARVYDATLGPLPAVADRVTFLVIRLRPADFAAAIARRGGGSLGALRAAVVTTRRIAAALQNAGIASSILTARQITDATVFLTDGIPLADIRETWSQLTHGATRTRTFAITPGDLPVIATSSGWSHGALSTTLSLRLRPGVQPDSCAGLLRITESPSSNHILSRDISGLRPLHGHQFEALCETLPVGRSTWLDRGLAWAPLAHLHPLPLGGCGQLLGADCAGRGVAVMLTAVDSVVAVGRQEWVWQLVARAVATGVSTSIVTRRRAYWEPLIATVADHNALSFGDHPRRSPVQLQIIDDNRWVPAQSTDGNACETSTRLHIFDHIAQATRSAHDAGIQLIQDVEAPGYLDLEVGGRRHRVSLVTTPDEWRVLGVLAAAQTMPADSSSLPVDQKVAQREPMPERTSPLLLRPAR